MYERDIDTEIRLRIRHGGQKVHHFIHRPVLRPNLVDHVIRRQIVFGQPPELTLKGFVQLISKDFA